MTETPVHVARLPRSGLVVLVMVLAGSQPNAWSLPTTVPDPSPGLKLLPGAATAGPPAWVHPGTRLVYYGGSASVPGVVQRFVLDDKGKWVDKDTGQEPGDPAVPGFGGSGYSVFQIGYVDHDVVELTHSLYLLNTLDNTVLFNSSSGMVTNSGCAADLWVHPDVLKNVKDVNEGGMHIFRTPFVLNNKKYNAIRLQTTTPAGYIAYVHDLDTGMLLFHGSSATEPGGGRTHLVTGWFVEVKDVDIPWKGAATPAWVGKLAELDYKGVQSSAVAGGMQFDRACTAVIAPKARGADWLRCTDQLVIESPGGMPPEKSQPELAAGPASIGGLWIGPDAIGKLKAGQVIDRNDVTKTVTSVTDASDRSVTISEVGKLHRIDWTYDAGSGVLSAMRVRTQLGVGQLTHRMQLVGQK